MAEKMDNQNEQDRAITLNSCGTNAFMVDDKWQFSWQCCSWHEMQFWAFFYDISPIDFLALIASCLYGNFLSLSVLIISFSFNCFKDHFPVSLVSTDKMLTFVLQER